MTVNSREFVGYITYGRLPSVPLAEYNDYEPNWEFEPREDEVGAWCV